MHGDRHVGRNVGDRRVDHAGVDVRQLFRIVAAVGDQLTQLRIAQIGEVDLVELEIAAAGVGEGVHRLAIAFAEVAVEIVHRRIDLDRYRVASIAEVQRRRRRDRHLRHRLGVRRDEPEMLDHRVRAVGAERAYHPQHHRLGLRALELDLALAQIGFDAVELAEEVVVPEGAAELAVGDRPQADVFLLPDDFFDLAVFDCLQVIRADLAALVLRPRLLKDGGPQQAADVISAERRVGARHDLFFVVVTKTVVAPRRRAIQRL